MAPQERTIVEVVKIDTPEGWHWGVISEIDGVTDPRTGQPMRHIHTIPPDAFEWRAAEYALDPDKDFETLLDILLHENYIPDPRLPRNHADDAAAAKGLTSPAEEHQGAYVSQGDPVPTHLYNAETVGKAKEALLARVEKVKQTRLRVKSPGSTQRAGKKVADPLDVLRNEKFIDADRLEAKRALVASVRNIKLERADKARNRARLKAQAPRAASRPLPPLRGKPPIDETLEKKVKEKDS